MRTTSDGAMIDAMDPNPSNPFLLSLLHPGSNGSIGHSLSALLLFAKRAVRVGPQSWPGPLPCFVANPGSSMTGRPYHI